MWHVIASMRGLRKLRILLESETDTPQTWRENEHRWFEPIRAFRPLEQFDVYVTAYRDWLSKKDLDLGSCRLHYPEVPGAFGTNIMYGGRLYRLN